MSADAVVELRQYTLYPHRRDELIALFERAFVEPQDAAGARVLGTFRDLDDPERFVWMRGFASMEARHAALTTFYDGALWKSLRGEAVATMRNSDNVLLLRPLAGRSRTFAARTDGAGVYLVLTFDTRHVDPDAFADLFAGVGMAMLESHGAENASAFATERSSNTFTRLPVRVDEHVFVCLARFPDVATADRSVPHWRGPNPLRDAAQEALLPAFMRAAEALRLAPTARSALR